MGATSKTLTAKFDGDTSGLARAARDGDRIVEKFGADAPDKFRREFDKGWASRGTSAFKRAAHTGLDAFGTALQGGIVSNPVLNKGFAAAVGVGIAAGLPAVGAVAAGGLVLGFGAGLAGLGLMTAAKSQVIKDTWSASLSDMGGRMALISKPFETTHLQLITIAERTYGKFEPALAGSFQKMAPAVTGFVDHFGRGMERLVPAIDPVTDAFTILLTLLGPATAGLLGNVSEGFQEVAASVARNPAALADMVSGAGELLRQLFSVIATLNDINGAFEDVTGGVSTVDVVMVTLSASVSTLDAALGGLEGMLKGIDAGLDLVGVGADEARLPLRNYGGAAGVAAARTREASQTMEESRKKAREQAQVLEDLITSMFRTSRMALTLSGSQIGFQAAIDDASAAVRANGRTLDTNTVKGRANRTALNNVAAAANAQTEALYRTAPASGSAGRAAETARRVFVQMAIRMGASKREAQALATALIGVPDITRTVTIRYRQVGHIVQLPGRDPDARAMGGPTNPNQAYLTGELGPELHMPRRSGSVMPNHQLTHLANLLAGGSGGPPVVVENHIEIGGEVVRVVRTELTEKDRRTKRALSAGAARSAPGTAA